MEKFYLLYLVPFNWSYQKGHMFSFFVFCPKTIMEFLSVLSAFLSSEDIMSGLNKKKNTIKVDSSQHTRCFFSTNVLCICTHHPNSTQCSSPCQSRIPIHMLAKYLWEHPRETQSTTKCIIWCDVAKRERLAAHCHRLKRFWSSVGGEELERTGLSSLLRLSPALQLFLIASQCSKCRAFCLVVMAQASRTWERKIFWNTF